MGAIWIAWVWHMSCYGWAMGMGRSWWLWSGYGYKFEGKCRALHLYIYDLTAIAHRERSEWRWSLCDLAARPPVECQWRTSQARGADRKGDRTLWGQEWQRWQVHAQLHKQFEAADARLPSFFFCFCILLPVRQSLAQAQGPVSRPQPSGEANRLSRRGRRGEVSSDGHVCVAAPHQGAAAIDLQVVARSRRSFQLHTLRQQRKSESLWVQGNCF